MKRERLLDSAAVFACASSLFLRCEKFRIERSDVNLSVCYSGIDQLMRVVMNIAEKFEKWAIENVVFEEFDEVWAYFLYEHFGEAVAGSCRLLDLESFNQKHCKKVAVYLQLPLHHSIA